MRDIVHPEARARNLSISAFVELFGFTKEELLEYGTGGGLGLYIAKRIIAARGETIAVVSEMGHGSALTITLPGSAAEPS